MSYTTRRQRAEGLRVCGLPGKMYLYIRDVPILPVSMSGCRPPLVSEYKTSKISKITTVYSYMHAYYDTSHYD